MSSFETGVSLALLLFWVSSPFGFRLVLCRFSCVNFCPFEDGLLIAVTHSSSLRHHGLNIGVGEQNQSLP